jgi:hypothetical protein
MPLVLSRMRLGTRIDLDPASGAWTQTRDELPDQGVPGFAGFADIRRVGVLGLRRVFVAVYILDGGLRLRVGDETFDLDAPGVRVSRSVVRPLLKSFEVWTGDTLRVRHLYWWADLDEWPTEDVLDIFLYVPTNLGTPHGRRRIAALWSLMQTGVPSTEAAAAVDAAERLP